MIAEQGNLKDLRDIVVPEPVAWWPLAVGWWVLLGITLVTGLYLATRAWQKWQANAYRRAALVELEQANSASTMTQILKRTALCVFPREEVASLSGQPWCDWLRERGDQPMTSSTERYLSSDAFRDADIVDQQELRDYVAGWIRLHRTISSDAVRGRQTC
ncbi:hypothetical protein CA13_28340 [Planctomycetes bacterium CA13]|uniref:DUF4381 domain-containing protein n=1 Tax=Novipirellula herctigrandis TaxID=2527986 RepID=A0A5C5Z1X2_9BACT|nr:hypothetical protein CA13_28340 [Planctomycetes bacterium CA13]